MALKQVMYADFSGGYNDTAAAISISDKETTLSENVDYSTEVKALKTRKGCTKLNPNSFGANVTDGYSWTVGSQYKKCIVMNNKVYELKPTGELIEKITLVSGHIYPFVLYDKLYFGDGSDLYVWGDTDYYSEEGTKDIKIGDVVKNNNTTTSKGIKGNFYQSLKARSVNLKIEDYTNGTYWTDVTDIRDKTSSIVKGLTAYDPSQKEVVLISITKGATSEGTITVNLDNTNFTFSVAAGDSVSKIVENMSKMTTTGWDKKIISNAVQFTKAVVGLSENGYFDPSTTGVAATYETTTQGTDNDNDLYPIRRCTMFSVHPSSYRVFATGNPDDNALFYSEIGKPNYFKSEINKVYPTNGYGKATGLIPLSDSMLVSYENGWYAWNGITPLEDATWKALNLPYGCVCNDSIALTPYSFTFLANEGIFTVNASILASEVILLQDKNIIKKITENQVEKTIETIGDKSKCKGIFYNNTYYLAFNTDGETNDTILKYEWNTKSFTLITGWIVNQWIFDSTYLYFATKNFILKANDGYSDININTGLEKPINLHIITKEYPLGNPLSQKAVQYIGILLKQNDQVASNVDLIIHLGYEYLTIKAIDLAESFSWGRNWGKAWGYKESIFKMIELNRISNTFQIEIKNSNLNDPITIIGVGFIYEEIDLILPNILKDEVLLT